MRAFGPWVNNSMAIPARLARGRKTIKRGPGKRIVEGKGFRLAARLARDGESEPTHIEETDTTFAIGWKGSRRIDGPAFVYSDHDTSRVTTILGYPTDKLSQTA